MTNDIEYVYLRANAQHGDYREGRCEGGQEMAIVRDFVYLDWERVRSLGAQLLTGLPEAATEEKQRESGVEAQIEGGIWGLFKGKGGVDYRYVRAGSETRSLHHHVYSLFEEALLTSDQLIQIHGEHGLPWQESTFSDGAFVLISGVIRFMDYTWLTQSFEALPRIMKVAHQAESMQLKQKLKSDEISQAEYNLKLKQQEKTKAELKSLQIADIKSVIGDFFGSVVRVKVVPDLGRSNQVFVGTCERENFQDSAAGLAQKYGYQIDAHWRALGQINRGTGNNVPQPIPTGNQLDDALEQVAFSLTDLASLTSSVTFPAVSFTPLSIYRQQTI